MDEVHWVQDLDGSLGNLRGNAQRLQEGSHSGLHTGVTGGHDHIGLGNRTSTSWRGHLVLEDQVTNSRELFVGEDESKVELELQADLLELGTALALEITNHTTHLGVLPAVKDSLATESDANLLDLV